MADITSQALNYVTTNLFEGKASDFGAWAAIIPAHKNMIYHQLVLVSSGVLAAGAYNVRIAAYEGENQLEATADTGVDLDITGANSAIAVFTGAVRGVHLEVSTPLTGGETISCVLNSAMFPFGALV
jgi:hypothetical protein